MSKFVYYIAYLQQDNTPIIPLVNETFKNELITKELIDNKILSFTLKKDLSLLINNYPDRSALTSIKSFITNINKIKTKKDNIKSSLINELKECNHVISFSFDDPSLYFEEKISFIARKIKGIVIDNNMNTFFPLEKSLKKLLSNTGTSSFRHYNPIIDYRQKIKTKIITKEDKLRWKRNNEILKEEGLILSPSYDFEILSSSTNIVNVDDIWNELIISHLVGYLSYCRLNNIDAMKEYKEYESLYDLKSMLLNHSSLPLINSLLANKVEKEDLVFYQNYSEIALLLLWVLNLTKYPSNKKKGDILKQSNVFKNKDKKEKLYSVAHIKSKNELLDMFDLTSRLFKVDNIKGYDKDIISFHLSAFIFVLNYDY